MNDQRNQRSGLQVGSSTGAARDTSMKSWAATTPTGSPDYVRGLQRAGHVSYSCVPKNIPMRTEIAVG